MKTFLLYAGEYLADAKPFTSKAAAIAEFESTATALARLGQSVEASLHIASNADEVAEYPDFVLSSGPRGGVRCERA